MNYRHSFKNMYVKPTLAFVSQKYQDSYMAATRKAAMTGDYVYECVLSDGRHSFLTGQQLAYLNNRNLIAKSCKIV